jgi:hypothetical protein
MEKILNKEKINLWNIINKYPQSDINCETHNDGAGDTVMGVEYVHKALKDACKQILELAAESVKLTDFAQEFLQEGAIDAIDKQSILDTINQIK